MALDEVGSLLQAVGKDDIEAFAALYDRTASVVFSLLRHALEEPAAAERATVRVYGRVWRTASSFDPAQMSGGAFLMQAVCREFGHRDRSWRAGANEDHGDADGLPAGRVAERTPARRERCRRPLPVQRHR